MFVTQVPVADTNYYCSPKLPVSFRQMPSRDGLVSYTFLGRFLDIRDFQPEERTLWNIVVRGLRVLVGLGLKLNGRHSLCGDYIYSGHTVVLLVSYLFISECKRTAKRQAQTMNGFR